jgi:hypothetical protein
LKSSQRKLWAFSQTIQGKSQKKTMITCKKIKIKKAQGENKKGNGIRRK